MHVLSAYLRLAFIIAYYDFNSMARSGEFPKEVKMLPSHQHVKTAADVLVCRCIISLYSFIYLFRVS